DALVQDATAERRSKALGDVVIDDRLHGGQLRPVVDTAATTTTARRRVVRDAAGRQEERRGVVDASTVSVREIVRHDVADQLQRAAAVVDPAPIRGGMTAAYGETPERHDAAGIDEEHARRERRRLPVDVAGDSRLARPRSFDR